jgi:hypothetical protein
MHVLKHFVLTGFVVVAGASVGHPTPAHAQTPPPVAPPGGEYYVDDDGAQAQEVNVGADGGDAYADTDPGALTDFRATLDPHGTWVDDPTYGQIWVPNGDEVGPNFAPYVSEGSWAYDDDYTWVSNYEWGWVPFHYGRWAWTGASWGWIPGRVYSGAWVNWRVGSEGYGYLGWGPMAPAFGWRNGVAFGLGAAIVSRPGPMVFVGRDDLFAPRIGSRVIVGARMASVAAETRPYVRAEPVMAGHPVAQGVMHGPAPGFLGIQASAIVHGDPRNPNVGRARAFARPSSALALGAHAPRAHTVRIRRGSGAIHGGGERVPERAAPERMAPAPRAGGGMRSGGGGRGRR